MKVPYVDLKTQYQKEKNDLLPIIDSILSSGKYILSEAVSEFENTFAKICNVKHAIGVANGTDALVIALKALDIGPGDEVITPANSWISSASCVALVGATPVFADVDTTYNIDPSQLNQYLTTKTKAIIPVHLTGMCADMAAIQSWAKKNQLFVIEDAAQSVGAKYGDQFSGSMGDVSAFSLHPLKNLNAVGDAGIITTNDDSLAQQMRLLHHHGLVSRNDAKIWGYNSRLDSIQAAVLQYRSQKLNDVIQKRRENANFYTEALAEIVECPVVPENRFHTYHLYMIQTKYRDELKDYLKSHEISTAIHYETPIHKLAAAQITACKTKSLPICETQAQQILSLPVHHYLSGEQLSFVVKKIRTFFESKGPKHV